MYLNTSGDLLNYILALAIVWLVVLLTWLLWRALSIMRGIERVVDDVEERVRSVDAVLHMIREKLESTSTYLGLLVDVVKEGIHWFRSKDGGEPSFKRKSMRK